MRKFQVLISLIVITAALLSACGGAAPANEAMQDKPAAAPDTMLAKDTAAPDAMMPKDTAAPDAMMPKETATPDAMMKTAPTADAMMAAPAWLGASLTDVRTGETFTINDFKGKVVLVETMAQWCSNCKKQQAQVKVLHEMLGMPADFVSIGLDIDPNENSADLKNYVTSNEFDWMYAVSPVDVSRELASLYGDQFINPPSTPILIVDREGVVHTLPFGIKSAEELFKLVDQYLKAGM